MLCNPVRIDDEETRHHHVEGTVLTSSMVVVSMFERVHQVTYLLAAIGAMFVSKRCLSVEFSIRALIPVEEYRAPMRLQLEEVAEN